MDFACVIRLLALLFLARSSWAQYGAGPPPGAPLPGAPYSPVPPSPYGPVPGAPYSPVPAAPYAPPVAAAPYAPPLAAAPYAPDDGDPYDDGAPAVLPYAPAQPPPYAPAQPPPPAYPPPSAYPPPARPPYQAPPLYPPSPAYPPPNTIYPPAVPYPSNAYYNYSTNYSIADGPKVLIGYLIRVSSPTIINATRGVFPAGYYPPPPPPPPAPAPYVVPVKIPGRKKYKKRRQPPPAVPPPPPPPPVKPLPSYYDPGDSGPWPSFPARDTNSGGWAREDRTVRDGGTGGGEWSPVPIEDYKKVAAPYNYFRPRT